jgi:hypothetical protein
MFQFVMRKLFRPDAYHHPSIQRKRVQEREFSVCSFFNWADDWQQHHHDRSILQTAKFSAFDTAMVANE